MNEAIGNLDLVDPADCRRRAERCRQQAQSATATRGDLLEAAATWETLARHAEIMQKSYDRLRRTKNPS